MLVCVVLLCFFFQAEDGIRDLVRSRGLGDVYKRQTVQNKLHWAITGKTAAELIAERADAGKPNMGLQTWKKAPTGKILKSDISVAKNYPVSYTHLTLPTSDLV